MNLFDQIPAHEPEELFTELFSNENVRIERIVSFGQKSADGFWYDQREGEWILMLEGSAQLRFEDGRIVDLTSGDTLNIPARCRHHVEKTAQDARTVWLAVFYKND
ncbi:MAG: cupin domain-containing protein [Kiritimatiellales bacterium]